MILEQIQTHLKTLGINSLLVSEVDKTPRRLVAATGLRVHVERDGELRIEKNGDDNTYNVVIAWLESHPAREQTQDLETSDESTRLRLHVYLPDADPETQLVEIESIRSAIGGLLEELGFEPDPAGLHVMGRGSWLWREWFKPSRPLQKEMSEIYEEMKEGLRREFLDKTGAEAFEKRANATAAVVKSLEAYSRAIVRLGDVIVAKAIVDGEPQLVVESLSPTIARELERRPELIRNPEAFIEFVGQYIETGTQVPANQEPLLSDPAQEQSIDLPRKG